jgi:hypothetical protein
MCTCDTRHAKREMDTAAPNAAPSPDGEGCIELLADRLREWPGIIAIEADFRASTLSVRYEPGAVTPDQLNTFADDVGALFAQRVTSCERRDGLDACPECALRFGRLSAEMAEAFQVQATSGNVRLARRGAADTGVEVVRPLSDKPWGATFTHAEEEEHAEGRSMVGLTVVALVGTVAGVVVERVFAPESLAAHLLYAAAAVSGGWFAA